MYGEKENASFWRAYDFIRRNKETVHTAGSVEVGGQPLRSPQQVHVEQHIKLGNSPHQVHVKQHTMLGKNVVLKFIGGRIRVEGARTDCQSYPITTIAT